MRDSNHSSRGRRLPSWSVGFFALIVVGCAQAAAPSASPTPIPTPAVTPDPHLTEPVTADQIFRMLGSAKLGMKANNATLGGGNPAIVKVINADIGNWPLKITEYRSSSALRKALGWTNGAAPVRNQAPFAVAGLNVLVEFGPISTAGAPKAPDAARQQLAASIVAVLDPLLWPLAQHSVVVAPARAAESASSAAPNATASKAP
jgi:hypothetical protein